MIQGIDYSPQSGLMCSVTLLWSNLILWDVMHQRQHQHPSPPALLPRVHSRQKILLWVSKLLKFRTCPTMKLCLIWNQPFPLAKPGMSRHLRPRPRHRSWYRMTIFLRMRLSRAHFWDGVYYPVNIGDALVDNFQVLGKLGFGVSSTVWLTWTLE